MSLTSYRAAPPRVGGGGGGAGRGGRRGSRSSSCLGWRSGRAARRRPTLPRLVAQYHGRWGVSRPSSGWDRVWLPRGGHRATGPDRSRTGETRRAASEEDGARVPCRRRGGRRLCRPARPRAASCGGDGTGPGRSLGRLGPLGCAHRCASTCGLSTWWSSTALMGRRRLGGGFALRCLQRLSRPHLATRPCRWRDNRCTRGASVPVLSY